MVYYRFHGVPDLYRSAYAVESLLRFVSAVNATSIVKGTWCYFNNDAAVSDAQALIRLAAG